MRQAEHVFYEIENWPSDKRLSISLICELQRRAITNIYRCAGSLRDASVTLANSEHVPPPHEDVPRFMRDMCAYVNDKWEQRTATHLGAYLLWRVNWIHPFFGGNGRTSRAVAYLILSVKLGFRLPGNDTVPDLIASNRDEYDAALTEADSAQKEGVLDISRMERFLEDMLSRQLQMALKAGQFPVSITPTSVAGASE